MRAIGLVRDLVLALLGVLLLLLPVVLSSRARGAEALPGPVPATVIEVIDGDTVRVKARIWIGQEVTTKVRLAGIEAPETGSRAKCDAERERGEEAKAFLESLIGGRDVSLHEVLPDKYGDRIDARIYVAGRAGPVNVSERMIEARLAVAWGAPRPWCAAV